ncbi:MAG: amino acid racemase, partial [Bacteroidota bacterium]
MPSNVSRLGPVPGTPQASPRDAIGVLGGLGPHAGLDLVRAILDETAARRDQDHLPVVLVSVPGRIPDRSAWIADRSAPSPVPPMAEVLRQLDAAGCAVAGVPCNTAHAPVLFDALRETMAQENRPIRLVHIVDAIVAHAREVAPEAETIGVLATDSSVENRLHRLGLEAAGLGAVVPDAEHQRAVQASIFDPVWGLKAQASPPDPRAREALLGATAHLAARGAEAVILGCTELPLAVPGAAHAATGLPFISSTRALAR